MTDVALERALDEAEDFPTRRDVGVQIARKTIEEAEQTGARVSGATLAAEYPQNKVRWWQDRLVTARAELDTDAAGADLSRGRHADPGISMPTADDRADPARDSAPAKGPNSGPAGIGMPTSTDDTESARTAVPTSSIGTDPALVGMPTSELGTDVGMPTPESARTAVPIGTPTSPAAGELGTPDRADAPLHPIGTTTVVGTEPAVAPVNESATTHPAPENAVAPLVVTEQETPRVPTRPVNGTEETSGGFPATTGHLGTLKSPERAVAPFGVSVGRADSVLIADTAAPVGMPTTADHADSARGPVPTPAIGTDPTGIGMPISTGRAESAHSFVPTDRIGTTSVAVGMPTEAGRADSARGPVPISVPTRLLGTVPVPTGVTTSLGRLNRHADADLKASQQVSMQASQHATVPVGMPTTTEPFTPSPQAVPILPVDQHEIRAAAKLQYAFYGVAVVVALIGQVWAGVTQIPWPDGMPILLIIVILIPAMAVIELAGVATSHQADLRRRLGEQAYGYRALSLLAAVVAAGFNLTGHWGDWWPAVGFTGLSVFAYCSWLMQSNARRRDALRAAGKLAATAPVYGAGQWVREPGLTKRARSLAVEHGYGVHESLRVAREEVRVETRRKALAVALERRIVELHDGDEIGATIAATTYDLDRLAAGVEARLDYAAAETFIAADLVLQRADRTGEQA